ncbi:MAG TPA: ABC transporter ATP-binding protein, partial [Longimicrobiales bacterium]
NVSKRFGDVVAVEDVALEVAAGEFVTLLGPSGCGKTTTLRMIAGFETATTGRILLDDRDLTRLPPQQRGIGMVFQNYALFPHLNVFENVAFGLRANKVERAQIGDRVQSALELVGMAHLAKRRVQDLSGGQQQRVAVARAIAPQPRLILLDEPLSNLDAAMRERTRGELRALLKRLGMTAIFVTHDQEEAFALSDRIAVMNAGKLQQIGGAEALYNHPANLFVAGFMGRANLLHAVVTGTQGDRASCEVAGGTHVIAVPVGRQLRKGQKVRLLLRPEMLSVLPRNTEQHAGDLGGVVSDRRFAGAVTYYQVKLPDEEILVEGGPRDARVGEPVHVRISTDARVYAYADL